jgi:ketosteroid isomerase-like protein
VDERGEIEVVERAVAAWNSGDLGGVVADITEDHEWDLTHSDIPGEAEVHRGPDAYLRFAQRWREALGPTQLEVEETKKLPDGRLFVLIKQSGTGVRSGAGTDLHYVQILSFEGGKVARTEVFTDRRKGRAAAGLDP